MRLLLRWLLRIVLGILGLIGVTLLAIHVGDRAILPNLFGGPGVGVVTQTQRNQPQEAVPGTEQQIPSGSADMFEPAALAKAEAYAAQNDSVALLVFQGGALRYEKYWAPWDRNTRTDSFSGHKTVMGLLMGAAIADGFVKSLDEPAATYIPEFRSDARREIRIRDLLQMSSGLEVPRFPGWTSMRITLGSDLAGTVTRLQSVEPPGKRFQYTNGSAQLSGLLIQNATGKRYAEYLSERLWSRIGAAPASLWLDREGGLPRTFCCIYTTARGWMQVGRLMMNQGKVGEDQVVPAEWIRAMTTPASTNPNYGLMTWLGSPTGQERLYNDKTVKAFHSEPFVVDDIFFIDGFGGQRVYMVPSRDLIIVRTGRAVLEWDDALIPNAILRGMRAPSVESAAVPAAAAP